MLINNQTPRIGYPTLGQSQTGKLPDTPQSESGAIPNGTQPENTYSGDTPYTKEASEVYKYLALTNINIHANNEETNKTLDDNVYNDANDEVTNKTIDDNVYNDANDEVTNKTIDDNVYNDANDEVTYKTLDDNIRDKDIVDGMIEQEPCY